MVIDNSKPVAIVDSHSHISQIKDIAQYIRMLENNTLDYLNILSLPSYDDERYILNPLCILAKASYPKKIYTFGSLNHFSAKYASQKKDYAKQVENLIKMGFDGIKMWEGKPNITKQIDLPLNSPEYDDFYTYLEKNAIPVTSHIADPKELWDKENVPKWAVDNGWSYIDGTFTPNEEFYTQVEDVLARYPQLKITFAHFFFMSADIDRASKYLEKWPSVNFDVTPGMEMYVNFSKRPDEWRDFFIKYQNRILFGTDNGYSGVSLYGISFVRKFLETNDEFENDGVLYRGLKLPIEVLNNIYFNNFMRFINFRSNPVNLNMAIDYYEHIPEFISSNAILKEQYIQVIDSLKELNM